MGLLLPARDLQTKQLNWSPPGMTLVLNMLHNPIYAGTYAYGRKEERMGLVNGKLRHRKVQSLDREDWKAVIHDRHPAYISWEEYLANEKKLQENQVHDFYGENRGAAREGTALLQGLVMCGRCARRMNVRYQGPHRRSQYLCRTNTPSEDATCWDVAGTVIEDAVVKLFLAAIIPKEIELALRVSKESMRQANQVDQQWQLRKERLQYEARLAERRYKAIDPDNRVVARTLEREWEEKLVAIESAEREHNEICNKEAVQLTADDRARVVEISKDLPAVWKSPTTTNAQRKNLLRILIREVTLNPVEFPDRATRVQVWWHTGAVSEVTVPRKDRYTCQATPKAVVEQIRQLFDKDMDDRQIAATLTQMKVGRQVSQPWDAHAVRRIRYTYGHYRAKTRTLRRAVNRREDGLYSIHGVAEVMEVTPGVVNNWANTGLLPRAAGGTTTKTRWFRLDEAILKRLAEAKAKRPNGLSDQKSVYECM